MFPKYESSAEKCSNVASSTLRIENREIIKGSKKGFSTFKSNIKKPSLSVLHATTATDNKDEHDKATKSIATLATTATEADELLKEPPNNSVALKSCFDCKKFDEATNYCCGYKFNLPKPTRRYRCTRFVDQIHVVDLYQQLTNEGIQLKRNGENLTIHGMKTSEQKNTIVSFKEELIQLLKVKEKLDCIECETDDLLDWYKDDFAQIETMSLELLQKHVEGYQDNHTYYRSNK